MTLMFLLLLLEWMSFIAAVFNRRKLGNAGRFVIYFLAAVVLTETTSILLRMYSGPGTFVKIIYVWTNIMLPVQCISLLLFFYRKTRYNYWKRCIQGFIGVILFITFLQFFVSKITQSNTFNYTLSAVFISACSLHYLFELMNSEEIGEVTGDPFMYLSIGLLLFYLGTLPFSSMRTYLWEAHRKIFYIYYYLFFGFNYFLYGIITVGIICTKKK
ncbi:hypothetical protein A8C56_22525 [Niabella ginsenosidivorans]|uniref:Histidine kinase N-terminal 7TM region domain-containing protein n=1 Tax=Niabella ginsenosidivorans TaxID=1176587 RepID=A0A1A9I8J4_9BACT|nr:hypothetical protein [Niabella ginsenosidivorans]ANH83389.1 hypothetical protein A8C56_22525 [Niabella ginsenosidivorans]